MREQWQELDPVIEEYVCDYVEDTMDPAVAEVFEEYLEDHQEVQAYVEATRQGKSYLQGLRFKSLPDPVTFREQLEQKVSLEKQLDEMESGFGGSNPIHNTLTIVSLILMLILGGSVLLL
jgi:anti-sigma factor RsiW